MPNRIQKRSESDPQFQWNPRDLAESDGAWQKDFEAILDQISSFGKHRESLTQSAAALLACLSDRNQLNRVAVRLYVYANMKLHEDSAEAAYQAMADKAENMVTRLSSALSFIEPSLLTLNGETLTRFQEEEPGLRLYAHYFEDLLRQKDHVLSPEMEKLLADAGEISSAADNIFSMLNNADMKFGAVQNERGEEMEVTHGRYTALMESYDRSVRQKTFETYYAAYEKLKNTLAATYSASVKKDAFFSRARKYGSSLEAALSGGHIPSEVYTNLIEAVHEALPSFHRYVHLRKKALDLPELHMYDIYTPIVPHVNTECPYEKAQETVLAALAPMGREYVDTVKSAFQNGWIDVYENEGKRSGAYSWGAYGCHPFVLLNYDNKIDDMFTLAHEMGHSMHSHYTWASQPYIYGDYTIFLAEVASTVNEALLMDHMRKTVTDKAMRAYLVNYFLEQFRGTVFRQTMFAEFEMITHQMAESGQPLTVESLSRLYRELNDKYYGPDMTADSQIDLEWSRIPHFYNAFYVFQYATGFSAAIAFSRRILAGGAEGEKAVEAYINFLKSGSSDYSIAILRKAGVDMSNPAPVREALRLFSELLGEMETLIG
ncbi:MAG: oligoendopeptidase F [Clostridiales bacterium]|jgi:oligoendopeptidase F|nr:oligoendopeptidase F [Clostridiales bacterium]